MRLAAIPLLLALVLTTAAAELPKTAAEADGYVGPVHTVRTMRAPYGADGKLAGAPVVELEQAYDTQGRRAENLQRFGEREIHMVYEWDGERLSRTRMTSTDGALLQTEYRYGPGGDVVETVVTNEHGVLRREVPHETASAKDTLIYGRDGTVERRVVQQWDEASHAWVIHDMDPAHGNKTVVQKLDEQSGKREDRMYDANGKPIQIFQRMDDGSYQQAGDPSDQGRTWSTMDKDGNPLEFFLDDGETFEWHKLEYDQAGRLRSQTNYDRAHKVIARRRHEYKEDEHGNWTTRTDRECDAADTCRVTAIVMRDITYW